MINRSSMLYLTFLIILAAITDSSNVLFADEISKQKVPSEVLHQALENENHYYDTIIDNNIFRELGWHPPKSVFPYQLIGIISYTNLNKKKTTAIIQQNTAQKRIYYVSPGDILEDFTVINIQPKKVILDTGKRKNKPFVSYNIF